MNAAAPLTPTSPPTSVPSTAQAVRALLHPRSVALIGASSDETKFSGQPLRNLHSLDYPGRVHVVNKRGGSIGGLEVLTSIDALPAGVEVAFVMVPAAACVEAVEQLGRAGVRAAVIAVSGFAELGTVAGADLQAALAAAARAAGVRLLGPNCNGIYTTRGPVPLGYNRTHSQALEAGSVAFVSHSGAMLGAFVPLLEGYGAGLSSFVSCGNEADLTLLDFVDHLIADADTQVVALLLDGVEDGDRFRAAARTAAKRGKSVVALKLGNSASGTSAAQAHSSRLAGSAAAYRAVFTAERVVSVSTVETLALAAAVLGQGRRPSGRSAVAVSTSGAGGVLLADSLAQHGVATPALAPETVAAIGGDAGFAQVQNPFDIGAAGPSGIRGHFSALAADPAAGALLFLNTPTPTPAWRLALAEGLAAAAVEQPTTPTLVVCPAAPDPAEAAVYRAAGIPVVASMVDAVSVVAALQVLAPPGAPQIWPDPPDPGTPAPGTTLSEPASKALLGPAGVLFPPEAVCADATAAARAAARIGYPVVLKAAGAAIAHKSEQRLVVLGVADEQALLAAFQPLADRAREVDSDGYQGVVVAQQAPPGLDVVVGTTTDRDFGPMVVFGAGGVLTELIDDVAVAPAPLDLAGAHALIQGTKVAALLAGYRGTPVLDTAALAGLLVDVSRFAAERRGDVRAIDLNPVRVLPDGAFALDALVELQAQR